MLVAFDACDLHLLIPHNFVYNMGGEEWISVINVVPSIASRKRLTKSAFVDCSSLNKSLSSSGLYVLYHEQKLNNAHVYH